MHLRKLTDDLAVAQQLTPADIPVVAAEGFRAIICNRPDGEAADQPAYAEIEKEAAALGLPIVYQPVVPNAIGDADVAAFGKAVDELPKPVLAYCRSGMRCTALWGLSQAGKRPAKEIVGTAADAGYDLRPFLARLAK
jgi:sulfide:quinone oxidoreductase